MRILTWVQSKFNGKQEKKRSDAGSSSARHTSMPHDRKEEFSDWPQALLSIGTFGNREWKEEPQRHEPSGHPDSSENSDASQDLPDFTSEEVRKLQKVLTELLSRKPKSTTDELEAAGEERASLPLNRFLNCPSSLEVDRTASLRLQDDLDSDNGNLSPNTKIILDKAKDLLLDNRNAMKKTSLTFLLKKLIMRRSGSSPALSLRDPIPEPRMEKTLRTLLLKKMYPRSSASSSARKCLAVEGSMKNVKAEKREEKGEDRCKWVKTDSEYIVLEI